MMKVDSSILEHPTNPKRCCCSNLLSFNDLGLWNHTVMSSVDIHY